MQTLQTVVVDITTLKSVIADVINQVTYDHPTLDQVPTEQINSISALVISKWMDASADLVITNIPVTDVIFHLEKLN